MRKTSTAMHRSTSASWRKRNDSRNRLRRTELLQEALQVEIAVRVGHGNRLARRRIDRGGPGTNREHLVMPGLGDADGSFQGRQIVGRFQDVDEQDEQFVILAARDG